MHSALWVYLKLIIMKKSKYYKILIVVSMLSGVCAILAPLPSVCALFCVTSFLSWFSAVMAPANEKYEKGNR